MFRCRHRCDQSYRGEQIDGNWQIVCANKILSNSNGENALHFLWSLSVRIDNVLSSVLLSARQSGAHSGMQQTVVYASAVVPMFVFWLRLWSVPLLIWPRPNCGFIATRDQAIWLIKSANTRAASAADTCGPLSILTKLRKLERRKWTGVSRRQECVLSRLACISKMTISIWRKQL